ncbi:mannosidase alpha class, variant 3 [Chamberlinius hualienensis]
MNDEAGNYYVDTIDEMTLGFRFLNDTFGPVATPRVAWQIDPFGHSKETALLFQQMGFDGLFFGRIDYEDKLQRLQTKTMEMIWNTSTNIEDSQLFAGAFFGLYQPPPGFCFDAKFCLDPPIQDNPDLKNYNVDKRVDEFLQRVEKHADGYATNHILMTMGGDFQFQEARENFINLDKLIKYVNEKQSNVTVFYSTPSCYLKALAETNTDWPIKTDDFMPYASDKHTFWTGYYTSRPTFKGLAKYTNNFLQIAKQLTAFANVGSVNAENLEVLKRYQADAQHHDAITGTEKQAVAYDYIQSLAMGLTTCQAAINSAFAKLVPNESTFPPVQQVCHYLNVSYCDITEQEQNFVLTVYNPQGHNIRSHVRVPITGTSYVVSGPDGNPIASQIVSVPQPVLEDPERNGTSQNELVFNVDLPPIGYNTYFVQSDDSSKYISQMSSVNEYHIEEDELIVIQNKYISVTVNAITGLLSKITDLTAMKDYNVEQNFYYYQAMRGLNIIPEERASGAYIFRPNGSAVLISPTANVTSYTGSEVQEIHQTFSDYVSQVIRLYPDETKVEFEWMIGPIPVDDHIGKEIITLYTTDFENEGIFYTDANGRQIIQRIRDYRPSWNLSLAENISGNYYPINSRIYIQDLNQDSQLTVMTDRSEGGGSISDGTIEIMLHRRLLFTDLKGVGEALNEPGVDGKGLRVRGKHWLIVSPINKAAPMHRVAGIAASNPPLIFVSPLLTTIPEWISQFKTSYSGLTFALPDNVNLVTVEPWKDGTVLIRLEHFYEIEDDPNGLSNPVSLNVQNLFSNFEITQIDETTLGANIWLKDLNRLSWNFNSNLKADVNDYSLLNVTLTPMKIRTFVAQTQYH